jgi:hypothetical protein
LRNFTTHFDFKIYSKARDIDFNIQALNQIKKERFLQLLLPFYLTTTDLAAPLAHSEKYKFAATVFLFDSSFFFPRS